MLLVPETREKTLEELDAVFGDTIGQEERELASEAASSAGSTARATTV
jgi:hypothetical protein